jgi:predicted kinase
MATVHMIHGFLGAGKTTLARELERRLPALRLTHDEWMLRLYGNDPAEAVFESLADKVSERLEYVWTRCIGLGLDVVLDLNFWSRKQRDRVREIAARHQADVRLYTLQCADDVAWERISRRNSDLTDSLFIARNTFEVRRRRFEPLGDDEPRVEVPS